MRYRPITLMRDWVQARIDAAILPLVQRCVPDQETILINAIRLIDRKDLAWHMDTAEFRKNVAQFAKEQILQDEIHADDLTEKVAARLSENFGADDVARHIDAEEVASYVDVDMDTIAEKLAEEMDAGDVARELDYDRLAETLVAKLKEAWA